MESIGRADDDFRVTLFAVQRVANQEVARLSEPVAGKESGSAKCEKLVQSILFRQWTLQAGEV